MSAAGSRRMAAEYGRRAVDYLDRFDRTVALLAAEETPAIVRASGRQNLSWLAAQAWANAKLAAHYAGK